MEKKQDTAAIGFTPSGDIYEKLSYIQSNLVAKKGQRNMFGKYNFRSCEDILESVKPLLKETGTTLYLTDDLVMVGSRYYVQATAYFKDSKNTISTSSFAREAETQKGFDLSQITGSASSYARKYALNGLFCIDDTKDSDSTNTHGKETKESTKALPAAKQAKAVNGEALKKCHGCDIDITEKVSKYSQYKFNKPLCFNCQKKS